MSARAVNQFPATRPGSGLVRHVLLVGGRGVEVGADELDAVERRASWPGVEHTIPPLRDHRRRTTRPFPVVGLTPR